MVTSPEVAFSQLTARASHMSVTFETAGKTISAAPRVLRLALPVLLVRLVGLLLLIRSSRCGALANA